MCRRTRAIVIAVSATAAILAHGTGTDRIEMDAGHFDGQLTLKQGGASADNLSRMVTRLLDDQHIRRRRSFRRSQERERRSRRDTVLSQQHAVRFSGHFRERLGVAVRVAALVAAIGGLITGLVIIGGDVATEAALTSSVVPDSIERASISVFESTAVPDAEPGIVEFERTEETEYVVAPGETLSEIADRFGLSYDLLAGYNDIADPDTVMPEQRILIPSVDVVADLVVMGPERP